MESKEDTDGQGALVTWLARDGTRLTIRPIGEGDASLVESFVRRLSFGARYFRYGRGYYQPSEDRIRELCRPDEPRRTHLLVLSGPDGYQSIVASARIVFEPGDKQCDLAIAVNRHLAEARCGASATRCADR
jgi:hypothetical protein